MKDSKGREYDGWVLRTKIGILAWTFRLTRREVYEKYGYPSEPGCEDTKAVKVLLLEVSD